MTRYRVQKEVFLPPPPTFWALKEQRTKTPTVPGRLFGHQASGSTQSGSRIIRQRRRRRVGMSSLRNIPLCPGWRRGRRSISVKTKKNKKQNKNKNKKKNSTQEKPYSTGVASECWPSVRKLWSSFLWGGHNWMWDLRHMKKNKKNKTKTLSTDSTPCLL